jgi:mono/diheme cytochrome c family protein
MQRKIVISAIIILVAFGFGISHVWAGCQAKTVVKTSDEIQVVVPFAVPVGVPVAPFAPYFYSYQQVQERDARCDNFSFDPAPMPHQNNAPTSDSPPTNPSSNTVPKPLNPQAPSVIVAHCAVCHGGQNPKANFSLEHPETLSAADRLKAIQAVISGRMPKGNPLSPDEVRAVIAELARPSSSAVGSSENSPQKNAF